MAKRDPLTKAVKILENQLEAVHGERMAVAILVWNQAGRYQLATNNDRDMAKNMMRRVAESPEPGQARVVQV